VLLGHSVLMLAHHAVVTLAHWTRSTSTTQSMKSGQVTQVTQQCTKPGHVSLLKVLHITLSIKTREIPANITQTFVIELA